MPALNVTWQGRWGNQLMIYLFCRALAERHGYELFFDDWPGVRAFEVYPRHYDGPELTRYNEYCIQNAMYLGYDVEFRGYAQTMMRISCGQAQMQEAMIYTKSQAQKWLKIRPDLLAVLDRILANRTPIIPDAIVAHRRVGDYFGYGYPVISKKSYLDAADKYFGTRRVTFVTEEEPVSHAPLPDELSFLPDFYRLMKAPTLLRGNSTFSFVASLLGNGVTLSPRIDGLTGGIEHDNVRFEVGNHCKLADFDFCSDLQVAP